MLRPGNPDFLAIQDKPVTVAHCAGGNAGGIGTRPRFGDPESLQAQFAAGYAREVGHLLRFTAMAQQGTHGIHLGVAGSRVTAIFVYRFQNLRGYCQV